MPISKHDFESLCDVHYALSGAVELAGQMDNPVKDIVVVCVREMGRILRSVESRAAGGNPRKHRE